VEACSTADRESSPWNESRPTRQESVRAGSSKLLVPARAAVAVVVKSRAILASTFLKYGSNGFNGHQRIRALVDGITPNEAMTRFALVGFDSFHERDS
jgi:hypothetical protein